MKTGGKRNIALSFVLTKEHRLRVFQNRLLKKIFGPEKEMLIGDWRILHNAELHYLFYHQILFG
jgi:hypothetical protein